MTMRLIPLYLFIFTILIGCNQFSSKGDFKLSQLTRDEFKEDLKPLKKVNYMALRGGRLSADEVELGRLLFSDPILSRNNDVSCATCHLSNHGFADGNSLSVGALGIGGPNGGTVGRKFAEGVLSDQRTIGQDDMGGVRSRFMFRNAPSTLNVVYRGIPGSDDGLFWDGRFGELSFQVLLPIHTAEEMCGQNFMPLEKDNLFLPGGMFFKKPVHISHSHFANKYSGQELNHFNSRPEDINGVPSYRENGSRLVPTRNECLAIAVAKVRSVPLYTTRFKKLYKDGVTDLNIAKALRTFISTHVADDSSYDRFVAGENTLTNEELLGLWMFFKPLGEEFSFAGKKHKGTGCIECHTPPLFGGDKYGNLGVRSDSRSPLTRPQNIRQLDNGFFAKIKGQRGNLPKCHIEGVTISSNPPYGPDIGRANRTLEDDDCFKFRVPPLRNVIETFPYFHHGTERAEGIVTKNFKEKTLAALRNVIRYHLRGPVNIEIYNNRNPLKPFFDPLFQLDPFIPLFSQKFTLLRNREKHFPMELSKAEENALLSFIAYGLWDEDAVTEGVLGNSLAHPTSVPSGFSPTITRDNGSQLEIPPNSLR